MSKLHGIEKAAHPPDDIHAARLRGKSCRAELLHRGALALIILFAGAAVADTPVAREPVEDEDSEEPDYADDGSRALTDTTRALVPVELRPISPTEERRLLGDWGDSAAETED